MLRLRMCGDKVLRTCEHKRKEATGRWRKLHNEDEMGRICTMWGDVTNACKTSVLKHEGKRAVGRFRHRWKDNIKMDFKETGSKGLYRIHLAHGRV
jgi:hypothetical protein